jgi:manganese transport protein
MKIGSMTCFLKGSDHKPVLGGLEILKYIGPGLLVTVGFIDPGNWAANLAAGGDYGYKLLWMVTLSTLMLVILQHNVAHLGIATGLCLSEAATAHVRPWLSRGALGTAVLASIATSLAEVLGAAIALNVLFGTSLRIGAILSAAFAIIMVITNGYSRVERWIIAFVSVIGLSFIYELSLVKIDWMAAAEGWVVPSFPAGSMTVIMSVLGAVVMPHNLFLHSEIIQSRQWNLEDDKIIKRQLDYEFFDTLFSMLVGWAINSAIIMLAAATFFGRGSQVTELQEAEKLMRPLLGDNASRIFAVALLCSGISSSITSGMAGGSIFAGIFGEPFHVKDSHSRTGILISLVPAALLVFVITNPFKGLVYSQMCLSIQLPITVFLQLYLTSSKKVMGKYSNSKFTFAILSAIGLVIAYLNFRLLLDLL